MSIIENGAPNPVYRYKADELSYYSKELAIGKLVKLDTDMSVLDLLWPYLRSKRKVIVVYFQERDLRECNVNEEVIDLGNEEEVVEEVVIEKRKQQQNEKAKKVATFIQDDEEHNLINNDDAFFDGCVDPSTFDGGPNEGEEVEHEDYNTNSPRINGSLNVSSEEDDEGRSRKKRKWHEFDDFIPDIDMKNPHFILGLRFATAAMFREAVRVYSFNIAMELAFKKNDMDAIRVVCEKPCPFVIYASLVNESKYLQVKTLNGEHTCGRMQKKKHANANYLAKHFTTKLTKSN
ncbi:uncharacterized protein Pyn_00895 [Prunus yedoensis var. nudiflora]|uniref:Uncharacterized protein n=1 Tax=Prunus yedoensis var. nudiflora TaxID=2094558 RepID=A0A314ZDU8_PRUYE|nr:uncharacterized protein Pyn_00895 [Prunus yedoensis var. nudiflora]